MTEKRFRLLIVCTHPVQYAAPVFRRMAKHTKLDILVAYCSLQGAEPGLDPGFGVEVAWDVPVLDGYPWVHIPNKAPRPGLQRFFGLINPGYWRMIRSGNFDAVLLLSGYMHMTSWIAGAAAKFSRVPLIFSADAHDLRSSGGSRWKSWVKKILWPLLFRLPSGTLVMSSGGKALLERLGIPANRITLAPYTVDNDWWIERARRTDRDATRRQWEIPPDATVVISSAKLQPWKRPLDLLEAFAQARIPSSFLVFAGEGPLRGEIERRARELGTSENVRLLGFINQTGLPSVYVAADVLVLPSAYEPFGLVVNEAMLCGRPVVVSDRVGARYDLVREGETGFSYPAGNVAALSGILKTLLSDPARLIQLGDAARKRMDTWTPEMYVDAVADAVERADRRMPRSTT